MNSEHSVCDKCMTPVHTFMTLWTFLWHMIEHFPMFHTQEKHSLRHSPKQTHLQTPWYHTHTHTHGHMWAGEHTHTLTYTHTNRFEHKRVHIFFTNNTSLDKNQSHLALECLMSTSQVFCVPTLSYTGDTNQRHTQENTQVLITCVETLLWLTLLHLLYTLHGQVEIQGTYLVRSSSVIVLLDITFWYWSQKILLENFH